MRTSFRHAAVSLAVALSLTTGCGGGDDDAGTAAIDTAGDDTAGDGETRDDAAGESADDGASDATAAPDDEATDDGDDEATDEAADDGDDEDVTGPLDCGGLFSLTEVEGWFGEPAQLTEEYNESLGQTVCTWETIEDPEDIDDLAFSLIVAQVYSGEPISGSNFVDPDIFDDVRMIDGIGDLAFSSNVLGTDYAFLDGEVAGFFSYSEIDMGDVDAEKRHTAEELEAMFRSFHERVMAT